MTQMINTSVGCFTNTLKTRPCTLESWNWHLFVSVRLVSVVFWENFPFRNWGCYIWLFIQSAWLCYWQFLARERLVFWSDTENLNHGLLRLKQRTTCITLFRQLKKESSKVRSWFQPVLRPSYMEEWICLYIAFCWCCI